MACAPQALEARLRHSSLVCTEAIRSTDTRCPAQYSGMRRRCATCIAGHEEIAIGASLPHLLVSGLTVLLTATWLLTVRAG
jgi:hypothetical protein